MAMRKMLVILGLGWLAQSACAVEPINGKNWNTHPSIVEIRAIYTDIVQALDAGKLKKQERKFITENCHHEKDTVRTLYTDAQGIHRLGSVPNLANTTEARRIEDRRGDSPHMLVIVR